MSRGWLRSAARPALLSTVLLTSRVPGAVAAEASSKVTLEPRSTHVTMEALHRAGGVPPGWSLTPAPGDVVAGRRVFVESGCGACHHVNGEAWAGNQTGPGPDLTGMGSHHPVAYFIEAILNPNAVLVEGPGYVGADGRSVMPSYPDMTLGQLANLVAYLASLKEPGDPHCTDGAAGCGPARQPLPEPAEPQRAGAFLVHRYEAELAKLADLEAWFRHEALPGPLARPEVLDVTTYVDRTGLRPSLVTVLAFRNETAAADFLTSPAGQAFGARFTELVGAHSSFLVRSPPLYRAAGLSRRR